MAERYLHESDISPAFHEPEEGLLVEVDFRPPLERAEIMRRIGAVAHTGWHPELDCEIVSIEPIHAASEKDDAVGVHFKTYEKGFSSDSHGMLNSSGWSGNETIRILRIGWNNDAYALEHDYILARNFRYQLIDHESRKRSAIGREELETLHKELWGSDSPSGM